MAPRPLLTLAAALLALLLPMQDARADACDLGDDLETQLISGVGGNCGQQWTRSIDWGFWDAIGQIFVADRYTSCGNSHDYDNPQDVWLVGCPSATWVRVTLLNLECNMDGFVLDNSCNGESGTCVDSSTNNDRNPEDMTWECLPGHTYYVSVERKDENWLPWFDDCTIWEDFTYTLRFECYENCENLFDDDGDGLTDCEDPECPVCREICDNGKDDDLDGLIDCDDDDCSHEPFCCDVDEDGWASSSPICGGLDCNDDDNTIRPDAVEIPGDGVDQNCDTFEDCYIDADGDFFGLPTLTPSKFFFCLGDGVANNPDDCDDSDPLVNPNAPERIANGKDDNCDTFEICYIDQDVDTYGRAETGETTDVSCTAQGWSLNALDCDDEDPFTYPGATDYPVSNKDENCDGLETCYQDNDGDGFGTSTTKTSTSVDCIGGGVSPLNTDCDDTPGSGASIFPGAIEGVADEVDQNCDTVEICWLDNDRDGFGNMDGDTIQSSSVQCTTDRASLSADDCDDGNNTTYPGAPDPEGDGVDQNCDSLNDCYVDNDGDGFGNTLVQSNVPDCASAGLSKRGGDCDDSNPAIHPDATEKPADGTDQNCDLIETCYRDADGDTYGRAEFRDSVPNDLDCQGAGVADNDDDCNDDPATGGAAQRPGATEIVNSGIDENCDGRELCYVDADNDGFGKKPASGLPQDAETRPTFALDCISAGVSANYGDCNDGDPLIKPSATETPANGVDQDCNGTETCYFDADNDNWGSIQQQESADLTCGAGNASDNLAPNNQDCNDNNAQVYPGAPTPTPSDPGTDYACDGFVTCYQDNDGDGYGSNIVVASGDATCSGAGVADNNLDCNDDINNGGQTTFPGATEVRNDGVDQNCDGFELCFQDLDGDGFGTNVPAQDAMPSNCTGPGTANNALDCNDDPDEGGASSYPGAYEIPANGIDDNCNTLEACYRDADFDGFGAKASVKPVVEIADLTCKASGYADNDLDCNDASNLIFPADPDVPGSVGGLERIANGVDENCDGFDACFFDEDDDNWGIPTIVTGSLQLGCQEPNKSNKSGDCYDVPPEGTFIYPGANEIPGNGIDDDCNGGEICFVDADGDGWGDLDPLGDPITVDGQPLDCIGNGIAPRTGDCDSTNPLIHPGAEDLPADGIDQNCDGVYACYLDQDRDDFGVDQVALSTAKNCIADGVADNNLDCLDVPPAGQSVYPGAPEVVGDGVDQNCDGFESCYRDVDRDGFGSSQGFVETSDSPDCSALGVSPNKDDCNDFESAINPEAPDIPADGIDQDCDGLYACYQDNDGDGYGITLTRNSTFQTCVGPLVSPRSDDCVDTLPGGDAIYPGDPGVPGSGAPEVFGNGIDENCDGLEACFRDDDGDGFGDDNKAPIETPAFDCVAVDAAPIGGDCDDSNDKIHPDANEFPSAADGDDAYDVVANGIDEDCDGGDTCYIDRDLDGFGDIGRGLIRSPDMFCLSAGESANDDDCLDRGTVQGVTSDKINPAAQEVCNEVDDDCDGAIDDDDGSVLANFYWFNDGDGDGFGTTASEVARCTPPDENWTDAAGDCNDSNPNINPSVPEICDANNVDENCNGKANNADFDPNNPKDLYAIDAVLVYPDVDQDGWGLDDPLSGYETCTPGNQTATRRGDCNDQVETVNPDMEEIPYDGFDNDCSPITPDDDLDGDGFCVFPGNCANNTAPPDCNDVPGIGAGVNPNIVETCNGIDDDCNGLVDDGTDCYDDDGDGFTENAGDCNDANATISPDAQELPNNTDDDCDGVRDEGTIRSDDDGDGYCEATNGCVGGALPGDCNDGDFDVNPGQTEVMDNGVDDDCDGSVDGGVYDEDGDGYTPAGGDCGPNDPRIYPGAPERPNGIDDDCDGQVDEGTPRVDDDGDGYCDDTSVCTDGALPGDCNDDDELVNPGATEDVTNSVDDDCDGVIDEGGDKSDDDGDGYAEIEGDCDDADPEVAPGRDELADGKDNDCDGEIDEGTSDLDNDGFTVEDGDCDDSNGWVSPEQPEVCDGIDNDCDGEIDEDEDGSLEPTCPDTGLVTGGERGCQCSSSGGSPLSLAWVLGLVAIAARRRRDQAA